MLNDITNFFNYYNLSEHWKDAIIDKQLLLTLGGEGGGVGIGEGGGGKEEPNHTTARKPGPLHVSTIQ
jgi:hypothetical protein